jgi:predicted transcriptional regulator
MGKIIIKSVERPREETPNALIKWFCDVFELDNAIEVEMLKKFIDAASKNRGISSSEFKFKTAARSTVIYHLNRFIDAGLVVREGRKYVFRGPNMSSLIEEIEYDINREMQKMLDFANELDKQMNRKGRK